MLSDRRQELQEGLAKLREELNAVTQEKQQLEAQLASDRRTSQTDLVRIVSLKQNLIQSPAPLTRFSFAFCGCLLWMRACAEAARRTSAINGFDGVAFGTSSAAADFSGSFDDKDPFNDAFGGTTSSVGVTAGGGSSAAHISLDDAFGAPSLSSSSVPPATRPDRLDAGDPFNGSSGRTSAPPTYAESDPFAAPNPFGVSAHAAAAPVRTAVYQCTHALAKASTD